MVTDCVQDLVRAAPRQVRKTTAPDVVGLRLFEQRMQTLSTFVLAASIPSATDAVFPIAAQTLPLFDNNTQEVNASFPRAIYHIAEPFVPCARGLVIKHKLFPFVSWQENNKNTIVIWNLSP